MITFIVQARLGSSRLPNKIFLPFYDDATIFSLMVEKLKSVPDCDLIIATSDNERDDLIERKAQELGVKCFRGSEDDVLKRFIDAAEANGADKIIRVCSDNPFLDRSAIEELVDKAACSDKEYISFNVNGTPSIKTHFGFWTEYVTLGALKKVQAMTDEKLYHEHVTNYIYANPDSFSIGWIEADTSIVNRSDIRLTIDTQADFNNAKTIYNDLTVDTKYPAIKQIVEYLDSHPEYLDTMKAEIIKNSK